MRHLLIAFATLFLLSGCAGTTLPFSGSDHRYLRKMIQTSHDETNTDCISFGTFREAALYLEAAHVKFLASHDPSAQLTRLDVETALGAPCQERVKGLTTDEVKFQLFGGLQTIPNAERLQHLGGIFFAFEDTTKDSGLRPTLHLEQVQQGPLRGVVAIYDLETGRVIHYNYTGTDNVDRRTLDWPLVEFFGFVAEGAAGSVGP